MDDNSFPVEYVHVYAFPLHTYKMNEDLCYTVNAPFIQHKAWLNKSTTS